MRLPCTETRLIEVSRSYRCTDVAFGKTRIVLCAPRRVDGTVPRLSALFSLTHRVLAFGADADYMADYLIESSAAAARSNQPSQIVQRIEITTCDSINGRAPFPQLSALRPQLSTPRASSTDAPAVPCSPSITVGLHGLQIGTSPCAADAGPAPAGGSGGASRSRSNCAQQGFIQWQNDGARV